MPIGVLVIGSRVTRQSQTLSEFLHLHKQEFESLFNIYVLTFHFSILFELSYGFLLLINLLAARQLHWQDELRVEVVKHLLVFPLILGHSFQKLFPIGNVLVVG